MEIRRPLRLLYVEWDDAATRANWMTVEELSAYAEGQWLTRQCGFLLEETEQHLMLAGSWAPEDEWHTERFGDVTRIPKTWIRQRRVVALVNADGTMRPRG